MEKILLTTRIRNGDRKAFDELCGRYYAMLVSYARLFMKDDWAEDVVQDVFLQRVAEPRGAGRFELPV